MLKMIAIGLGVAVAGVLGLATTQPDTLHVERSTNMKAPPSKIIGLIEDLHKWNLWSPYDKKDPAMKRTYSGAPSGKGAVYEWNGNRDVGSGRMEITDVAPDSKVTIKLDFVTPFEGHNIATFTLEPKGDTTAVTWSMDGPNSYMGKVMCVFINMDKMIGTDFEAGLANMKAAVEQ